MGGGWGLSSRRGGGSWWRSGRRLGRGNSNGNANETQENERITRNHFYTFCVVILQTLHHAESKLMHETRHIDMELYIGDLFYSFS